MTAKALRVSATTLTLLISGAAVPMQAQKPKPVTTVAATMTFRCYSSPDLSSSTACAVDEDTNSVAVAADHVGDDNLATGRLYEGGLLGSTSAYLKVTGTGRAFRLFLHEPLAPTVDRPLSRINECATSSVAGCNPDPLLRFNGTSKLFGDAEVHIKVLDSTTLADASLTAMRCDNPDPSLALVHFTIRVPGGEGHWGLNFNKRAYHSTGAWIRRTGSNTWVVEATALQDAELISFNHSNIVGKKGPSHEGRYVVPFQLTIETTGLPSGSTTCAP